MKKVIKKKLFFVNGCSKNYFLWEIVQDQGMTLYEIIEEFRGRRVSRAILHGLYLQKMKAFSAFKRLVNLESARIPRVLSYA